MASYVSPGVYVSEQDFSLYVPALSTTQMAMVGTALRGTPDERVLITSEDQLVHNFGTPSADHKGLHAAIQYLRQGNQLTYVRVAGYAEAVAEVVLPDEGGVDDAVTFNASTSGSWANDPDLEIVVTAGSVADTYKITIKYRGVAVEIYDAVILDDSVSDDYIATRMADSVYVVIPTGGVVGTTLKAATYKFAGGDDGSEVTNADVIGEVSGATRTGLKLFEDPEIVDVNTIAVPGNSNSAVITELISMCESRMDCMTLIDPPYGLSVQGIIDWHNGSSGLPNAPAAALNSSYAALYWPHVQVYDAWTDSNIWLSPSGHLSAVYALTDLNYDVWVAPAGWRRGRLPSALDVEYQCTHGDRERLYGGRAGAGSINAINPIASFQGQGVVVWGQRTLQRSSTALDRVSVRRLLLYLRKVIATATQYLVFEPNDYRTWNDFTNLVSPYLESVKSRRGLTDFKVIMDETTNTADVIARNEMAGRILLQPMSTAEVINLTFTLLPQGANFSEFST